MNREELELHKLITASAEGMAAGFDAADDGDGLLTREELEQEFGLLEDEEWAAFDEDGSGSVSLEEWQRIKMTNVQKGVLVVRSAFESCMAKEMRKLGNRAFLLRVAHAHVWSEGFDMSRIVKWALVGVSVAAAALSLIYFAMKAANAIGAASAMVSSGMSAGLLWFMNKPQVAFLSASALI